MQEIRVKVNQTELQIRECEQEGDAIIFLHFSGANLMMWQRIIPNFQDHYRLILVDLRGHGKSDRSETGYHMDEMARDVIGVMQHLKLERAHIVGSSLGAEVGLSMAVNYPAKVISLVLDGALSSEYGPYGTWEGSETEFEEHVASQLETIRNAPEAIYPSLESLVDDRRELFEKYGWWNEYLEAVVRYDAYKVGEGEYLRGMGKQATENYMSNYFRYRFEDYYQKVKCPLLMLAEKELDDEREMTAMKGLRELSEQGEIAEVSEWAHPYCWLLNPEDACKAILKFLGDTAHLAR
ncbi:MAG: alpha/beta hydrolase [Chloroflexota bacterium]|nr:alpha/beta hydrolase [Chloroflexota bacterium]